ncbi:hypothetical protein ACFXPA_07840, partial [Amycolatopsis sp. NPDC059090]
PPGGGAPPPRPPPAARPRARAPALGSTPGADPYAGLAEAVWTVARLGRGADTATAAPAPDDPAEHTDSPRPAGVESGTRPRLSRLGLDPIIDPHPDSAPPRHRDGDRPRGRFDLIITALHPHTTHWLAHTDWDHLLAPRGLLATVTYSDNRAGRLRDPHPALQNTSGNCGLRCLDHIAVLAAPVPTPPEDRRATAGQAGIEVPGPDVSPRAAATVPPLRLVHHDLVLLGRMSPDAADDGLIEGKETSDV